MCMKQYDLEKDFGLKPSLFKKQPNEPLPKPPKRQKLIVIISSIAIAVVLGTLLLPSKYKKEIDKAASVNTNIEQKSESTTKETPVEIANQNVSPPESFIKSIKIIPTNPTMKDTVKATVEFIKPEHANEVEVKYEWLKNNSHSIEGVSGDTLPAGLVERGNYINVRAYAIKDGKTLQTFLSNMTMVVNSPPALFMSIVSNKVKKDEPIIIQLRAEDPEGDKITFSLDEAPEGMSINPSTGRITYKLDKPGQGSVRFKASAIDSEGAKVSGTYEVNFAVQTEK